MILDDILTGCRVFNIWAGAAFLLALPLAAHPFRRQIPAAARWLALAAWWAALATVAATYAHLRTNAPGGVWVPVVSLSEICALMGALALRRDLRRRSKREGKANG